MKEHRIEPAFCPGCCAHLDAASGLKGDEAPRPGDITVCIYCCGLLRFIAGGRLELLRGEERREALEDADVRRVILAAAMVSRRLGDRADQ